MVQPSHNRIEDICTFDLNRPITEPELMELAGNLGQEWYQLGVQYLKITSTEIDNIEASGKDPIRKKFMMLNSWKCKAKENATVCELVNFLNKINVGMEAWEFLLPKHNETDLWCKCCNSISCKCQCKLLENKTILASAPAYSGLPCTIKSKFILFAVKHQNKILKAIEELLTNNSETKENLLLDIFEVFHNHKSELFKIRSGCIEFHLQILSYSGLLKFSEDSRFLKNSLHQKIEYTLRKHLAVVNTIGTFSFVNNFKGGSYKKALELFTGGKSIDDMLPIVNKKIKYQRVIDYLCIDMKTMRRSTLNDLRSDFLKQRNRKLCDLKRKVKIQNCLNNSDRNFILKLIEICNNPVQETTVCDLPSKRKQSEKDKAQNQASRTKTSRASEREVKKSKTPKTPVGKELKSYGLQTQMKKAKEKHTPEMKSHNSGRSVKEATALTKSEVTPKPELTPKSEVTTKPELTPKLPAIIKSQSAVMKRKTTCKVESQLKKMKMTSDLEQPMKKLGVTSKLKCPRKKMISTRLEKFGFVVSVQKSKSTPEPESPVDKVGTTSKSKHPAKKMKKLSHTQEIPTKKKLLSQKFKAVVKKQESISKLKAKQDNFRTSRDKKQVRPMKAGKSQIMLPAGSSFYSDTSRRFEVVDLNGLNRKPNKCYGCRKPLMNDQGNSLILKTQDTRDFFKDNKRQLAFKPSNVYFHCCEECVVKKFKCFDPHSVEVPNDLWCLLNSDQQAFLKFTDTMPDIKNIEPDIKKEEKNIEKMLVSLQQQQLGFI